jgi:hypothetical protein
MEKIFLLMDKESYEDDPYGLSKARAEAALARRAVARSLWTEGMVPAPGFFFKHELQQMIGQGIRQNICYLMRSKVTDGRYATVPKLQNLAYHLTLAERKILNGTKFPQICPVTWTIRPQPCRCRCGTSICMFPLWM